MENKMKIPKNGLIPFAMGEKNSPNEIEMRELDVKWLEDCSEEELEEFKNNGFVEKNETNYNKKLETLKRMLRGVLVEDNLLFETTPYIIKGLSLPCKTIDNDYEWHVYQHYFNDLFFCKKQVDEVDSKNPDDWVYYPIGMLLNGRVLGKIDDEYSYQDVIEFLFWFEDYLKTNYEFIGDKILFGNKIIKISDVFKK